MEPENNKKWAQNYIESFHLPGQDLCTFFLKKEKENAYMRKELNSHRIGL